MEIPANTPELAIKLYQSYQTLSKDEQLLLRLLAIVYKPVNKSHLRSLLALTNTAELSQVEDLSEFLSNQKLTHLFNENLLQQDTSGIRINTLLINKLAEISACSGEFKLLVNIAEQIMPVTSGLNWQEQKLNEHRLLRDFYYLGEINNFERLLSFHKNPQQVDRHKNQVLVELFFQPFDLKSFLKLPDKIQYQAFAAWLKNQQIHGYNNTYSLECLDQVVYHNPNNLELKSLLTEQYLLTANLSLFKQWHRQEALTSYSLQLSATYELLTGNLELAIQLFEKSIQAKNKYVRRKKQYLADYFGYFYKLALMIQANQAEIKHYETALNQIDFEQCERSINADFCPLSQSMIWGINCLQSGKAYLLDIARYRDIEPQLPLIFHLICLTYGLTKIWHKTDLTTADKKQLKTSLTFFQQAGLNLFSLMTEQVLAFPELLANTSANQQPNESQPTDKLINFTVQIAPKEKWELALDKLIALENNPKSTTATEEQQTRLIWEITQSRFGINLSPKEQKQSKSGWSKGRAVSLKRLYHEASSFDYLTEKDRKISTAIGLQQSFGYYSKNEYFLEGAEALLAAVGAPNLYLNYDLNKPVELIEKPPEILVSQHGEQICFSLEQTPEFDLDTSMPYAFYEINSSTWGITLFNAQHIQVAQIIGETGLLVPIQAKDKALKSISAIAPLLNIHSDISELETGLETIAPDPHLFINIQPYLQGLEFNCVVMPFGEQGPAMKPTIGSLNLTTQIDGKRLATLRDLIAEQKLLDALDKYCPAFLAMPDTTLRQDEMQDALDTLEQLESLLNQTPAPFAFKLRWPKGKKLNLSKPLKAEHLQLAVNKKHEWFELEGHLQVDNQEVIELKKLLETVSASKGRFIQLDNNQVLALSQDLRARLEQINHATDQGEFHPLASIAVDEATQGMRLKTLHAWQEQTQKMHESNQIKPKVPNTLQAQLRDYQIDGFVWMSRLAHWGAGACLADDMGLGKTLQALAILLQRAPNGPALIIAPTSVCFNWVQEIEKFAPTLNIKLFADSVTADARIELIHNLNPFDCVIISYGLLQRECELLSNVHWCTIVADEAQAIKNPLTKRSKAAFKLTADFKIITTGTPIENDLTELWSLFKFVNPGLLGNLKIFGKRYIQPINNAKEDKQAARKAQNGLRHLIKPFILRRMKNQVLTELPPRTDINIAVHLSEKEQAFYEALRLSALENISQVSSQQTKAEQRIQILAELTKLRQACCHPELVMPNNNLPSAKLNALDELLDELKQNNHKALIFSQFVGHLQLIRQHLDKKRIRYQYLDGSTPQKDRQRGVNAFQSGVGDVFLISLKAGGFGLNLTAADYVIHMDPWWNPAVEEQASDRAHRMGQQRPVTIYRLIAQNTIEEKIVSLHQQKRDLAEQLLSGNDTAQMLSVDDMLALLKNTF